MFLQWQNRCMCNMLWHCKQQPYYTRVIRNITKTYWSKLCQPSHWKTTGELPRRLLSLLRQLSCLSPLLRQPPTRSPQLRIRRSGPRRPAEGKAVPSAPRRECAPSENKIIFPNFFLRSNSLVE